MICARYPRRARNGNDKRLADTGFLLGFDFGQRRIGVAVGQRLTATATAIGTIGANAGEPDWNEVAALIKEWHPEALVVGIPLQLDGSSSGSTGAAERFARQLEDRFRLPVHRQDERLTSREAEAVIRAGRESGKMARKAVDTDRLAAQIILQSWLEGGQHH